MSKVYVISNSTGFLSKTKTKTGQPKFFEPKTMNKVWITMDRFEAEEMEYQLKLKGYINQYDTSAGIVELDNDNGMYDSFLSSKV